MISKDCRFEDFAEALKGKDYYDILYIIEQEATEAERLLFRGADAHECGKAYADTLKRFMVYMRQHVRPSSQSDADAIMFQAAVDNMEH